MDKRMRVRPLHPKVDASRLRHAQAGWFKLSVVESREGVSRMARTSVQQGEPAADRPIPIGPRVRHLRQLKGLRLKDLAGLAGCSESLVSRIENDLVTPSLSTIHRICKALGVNVSALVDPVEQRVCTTYGPHDRPRTSHGPAGEGDGSMCETLTPFGAERMLEGLLLDLPGGGPLCGPFEHAGEEVGYVLEGELELIVEGERHQLPVGHSFFFSSSRPHSYRAHGAKTCRVLWINTPPTF
jgi:DNA-binding XRE family transcriptional regulator